MSPPKPIKDQGVEDLSTRARRFGLSDDEQRLFDRACDESPTLRLSHEVGGDFDRIAVVRAGDEALIARVADRVLAASRRRKGRGRWAWGIGAAVVLLSSGALAWWNGVARHRPPALVRSESPSGEERPNAPRSSASNAAGAPAEEAPWDGTSAPRPPRVLAADDPRPSNDVTGDGAREPSAPPVAKKPRGAPVARAAVTYTADASDMETAAECFRKANAARRAGDFAAAGVLYAKLQSKFPTSDEARLSHVSLGKLLLSSGKAVDAERQFSLYLALGGRDLAEEALVGRAESLQRLGRSAEERQTWERLLQDSPASVYAARAKQRLRDL